MVAPFENAVVDMEASTYTGPIQTQFGYHLIFLNDRRLTASPSFEAVRGELEVEIQNIAVEEYLQGLMTNTDVVMPDRAIDPSILSTLDLIERGYNVFVVVDTCSSGFIHDRNVGIAQMQAAGAVLITV